MVKRLKRENVDVVSKKGVRSDDGKLTLTFDEKLKSWQSHYQKLLNVEFKWTAANLKKLQYNDLQLRLHQRWCLKQSPRLNLAKLPNTPVLSWR